MTVKQLQEKLKGFPSNALVLVDGYEDGLCSPKRPRLKKIVLSVLKQDYYGPHTEFGSVAHRVHDKNWQSHKTVDAVLLHR